MFIKTKHLKEQRKALDSVFISRSSDTSLYCLVIFLCQLNKSDFEKAQRTQDCSTNIVHKFSSFCFKGH